MIVIENQSTKEYLGTSRMTKRLEEAVNFESEDAANAVLETHEEHRLDNFILPSGFPYMHVIEKDVQ